MSAFLTVTVTSPRNALTSRMDDAYFSLSFTTARLFSAMSAIPFPLVLCMNLSGVQGTHPLADTDGVAEGVALLHDLLLELDQAAEQRLRPRRAAGDVDVDRQGLVDPLHYAVGVENSAG